MTHMFLSAGDRASGTGRSMRRVAGPLIDPTGLERTTFRNRRMELFVWSYYGLIKAFELHYGIDTDAEWSVLWTESGGTSFHRVDPLAPRTMVPAEADQLPIHDLHAEFVTHSRLIDEPIRRAVLIRLSQETRKYSNES